MACQVILELRAKEDCIDATRSLFKGLLADTREFDGCTSIYFVKNQDDPQSLMVIEQWDSRPQYEKYLAWRVERGDLDKIAEVTEGEPNIRFFDYLKI